jgi:diguanylate cyclase (GGDEF)-like protein
MQAYAIRQPTDADTAAPSAANCDEFLRTAKARLSQIANQCFVDAPELQWHPTARRVRSQILDCVGALEQLHTRLAPGVDRYAQLEQNLSHTREALAQVRAELIGSQADEKIARYHSLHDRLTSLPNRSFFRQRLDQALACVDPPRQALTVFYLDLDGFKPLNDRQRHDAGDQLLRIVSLRLAGVFRAEDMLSRMGGDEFACLLAGQDSREHLRFLAGKVYDSVSAPFKVGHLDMFIRPSIGIATFPADGATSDALLKSADAAMYRAKLQGTGHAFSAQRP